MVKQSEFDGAGAESSDREAAKTESAEEGARGRAAARLLSHGPPKEALNRLAALAAQLVGAKSAHVCLVTDVEAVAGVAGLEDGTSAMPASDSLCAIVVKVRAPIAIADARADPAIATLPPVLNGVVTSYAGVPLTNVHGEVVGALCVFDASVRDWTQSDVTVLEKLSASVLAELELAALSAELELSRTRAELAIDSAGIGSFDWDLASGLLSWDDRLLHIFGLERNEFDSSIANFGRRVHPDDLDRVARAQREAIAELSRYEVEYRIVLPSGELRWIHTRGSVLADESGRAVRMLGVALDNTDIRTGEANLVRVLESMSSAFISMNPQWQVTYVNAEAERLLGIHRSELMGQVFSEVFPVVALSGLEASYRKAAITGSSAVLEAYYPAPLNAWFETRIWPSPEGIALYFLEVTDRRAAQELVRLSAHVGEYLAGSLDMYEAVSGLAELLVPELADWSMVSLVQPDGSVRDVATCHVNPALRGAAERYSQLRAPSLRGFGPVSQALKAEEPMIVADGATALAVSLLNSPEAIAAIQELAPESAVVLPLSGGGKVAGILTLCRGRARPAMSPQELTASFSIARRAGMALENARLYAEQRSTAQRLNEVNSRLERIAEQSRTTARALQDAMLTQLPEPDHLHIVARYRSASESDQVGGDWYDAIMTPNGATSLMIGDVVGHDIKAAAVMGQLRNVLRAFAWDHEEPPSEVVARLDRAMPSLQIDALATVVLALIEQTEQDRLAGLRTLRWTNAGHPAPVLLLADGTATVLNDSTDVLLGVTPGTIRRDYTCPLPAESTLLLYTDGLIETRSADLDSGQQRLLAALQTHHELELSDLLDAILADLVGLQPADDVAVLAVRMHTEDRPRPAEAGPADDPADGPAADPVPT